MVKNGLTVTTGDLKDLINNGTALYDQIKQTVKSNAGMFKLPVVREKFISENVEALQHVVSETKIKINRILAAGSMNPMTIEAFAVKNGLVSVSAEWIEQLEQSHTIYSTPEREKAIELIANVEVAIKNLNDHLKGNQFFRSGISIDGNNYRCLLRLSANGELYTHLEAIEFV